MRAILVRDPNKMIAASVLSSPKLTEQEVETFARMANVSEDVLRIIGNNRAWMKNYRCCRADEEPQDAAGDVDEPDGAAERPRSAACCGRPQRAEPLRVAARKKLSAGSKDRS